MHIETLRLRVSGEELHALLLEHLPQDAGVENLELTLTADGVQMTGKYTGMLLPLSFDTLWVLGVAEGQLRAQLAQVRVAGFPATKLRSVLLAVLAENIAGVAGLQVSDDRIHLDVNALLQDQGIPVRIPLSAVHCQTGWIILEAGS